MRKLLLLSALGMFVAAPVFAEDEAPMGHHGGAKGERGEQMMEKMFEKNDLDKDGAISKEEFLKGAEERFAKMDADGDGKITKDEAKKHHEDMRAKWKEKKEHAETPAE